MRHKRPDIVLEGQLFLLALQFLTRLPVPRDLPFSDDLVIRSVKYYPAVGVLVGGLGALVLLAASALFPPVVAVLLSVAVVLLITGGFHEDGLADSADGLLGGADKGRALEIMRDSRIGTYGALALGVVLALKVAALSAMPASVAAWALVAGHGLGRMGAVHIIATTAYARTVGQKFAAPSVTADGYRWALSTAFLILIALVLTLGPGAAFMAVLGSIALGQLMRFWMLRKLDGYTGDTLGAVQQMCELGLYLGVLAWL